MFALCAALVFEANVHAGTATAPEPRNAVLQSNDFEVPHLEIAAESAYLLSILGNPNNYEIGAEFITARLRWGVNRDADSWFRGYNQVYLVAMAEPIFRGPENRYFGISTGFRHVFIRPGWRIEPSSPAASVPALSTAPTPFATVRGRISLSIF